MTSVGEVISGTRTSSTSRRKPCGVCASARSSRGIVPSIQQCDPSRATCFTVSCTRRAGDRCALARGGVDDPADDRAGHERTCRIVHEHDVRVAWQRGQARRHRILPPRAASHHVQQLGAGRAAASVRAWSTSPSGTTTTMPRTRGDAAHAATLRSKMVRSPIDSHCLATAPPSRRPLPPAATTTSTITIALHASGKVAPMPRPTRTGRYSDRAGESSVCSPPSCTILAVRLIKFSPATERDAGEMPVTSVPPAYSARRSRVSARARSPFARGMRRGHVQHDQHLGRRRRRHRPRRVRCRIAERAVLRRRASAGPRR